MKEIRILAEQIRDELDVAEEYAREAAKLKESRPDDASGYADMAREELDHADTLHKMAVRAIDKAKEGGATAPAAMQAVWDWEHERMLDRVSKIKTLLSMA